jgi:predicted Zn-dependent protease
VLAEKLAAMRQGLAVMARPARVITPGRYRAYLAPAAVEELMGMLAWGGFDLKSHRTRQTPLLKLIRGERAFDPRFQGRQDAFAPTPDFARPKGGPRPNGTGGRPAR